MADSSEGYVFNSPAGFGNVRDNASIDHDSQRQTRYSKNWQFYLGQHWTFTREDGEPLVTVNYLKALINKKISFLVGADFAINTPAPLQNITLPLLTRVWESNGRQALNYEIAQEGHVTGDCFLLVTVAAPAPEELRFNPEASNRIVIQRLNSADCIPEWDELAPPTKYGRKLARFTIQQTLRRPQAGRPGVTELVKHYTIITDKEIVKEVKSGTGKDEKVLTSSTTENVLGEIPVTHIKNQVSAHTLFGIDDVTDILNLNREYNEKSTDISDTINYNAAPITVIVGAKAKNLERGPRAIWSGLPQGATVSHLKLEGELSAAVSYLERIKKAMHELAGVPEGALTTPTAITGASGETLNAQLAPMQDERNKKKATYEPGYERVNYFILRYAEIFLNVNLPQGLCEKCGGKIAWIDIDDPQDGDKIQVKRCYLWNQETQDFMHPDDMKVPYLRHHSFGVELAKVTPAQAATEHGQRNSSYYDPAPKEAEEDNSPDKLTPGISYPNEPETLDLPEVNAELEDGAVIPLQDARKITAIPVDCDQHSYLNPYTNWVTFNETLPKDKKAQADLMLTYQQLKTVSRRWIMEQIGIEDIDQMQHEIRQEEAADFAAQSAMDQQSMPEPTDGQTDPAASDQQDSSASAAKGE